MRTTKSAAAALKIIAEGPDEAEAVDAIQRLFDNRFEEE